MIKILKIPSGSTEGILCCRYEQGISIASYLKIIRIHDGLHDHFSAFFFAVILGGGEFQAEICIHLQFMNRLENVPVIDFSRARLMASGDVADVKGSDFIPVIPDILDE